MIDWIIQAYSNNTLIQIFFWGPVVLNGVVYPFHVWARYQEDREKIQNWHEEVSDAEEKRKQGMNPYTPKLYDDTFISIGDLFWYLFLTIAPILNALATVFDAAPIAFRYLSHRFAWLFSIKLVGSIPKK